MMISKLKAVVAVVLVLSFFVTGATVLTFHTAAAAQGDRVQGDRALIAEERVKTPQKAQEDKKAFTAWGSEVGGLQAGLSYCPGAKRVYIHGESVTLIIRIRNVGKEEVKFSYLQPFIEHAPIVTDGDGKPVPQPDKLYEIGARLPRQVELAPGKEIEIHELKRELRPASESKNNQPRLNGRPHALYGTGKIRVRYEQVLGDPAMGHPRWKLDPVLSRLGTGELEIEIKSDPPPKAPEKREPQKQEEIAANGEIVGG